MTDVFKKLSVGDPVVTRGYVDQTKGQRTRPPITQRNKAKGKSKCQFGGQVPRSMLHVQEQVHVQCEAN